LILNGIAHKEPNFGIAKLVKKFQLASVRQKIFKHFRHENFQLTIRIINHLQESTQNFPILFRHVRKHFFESRFLSLPGQQKKVPLSRNYIIRISYCGLQTVCAHAVVSGRGPTLPGRRSVPDAAAAKGPQPRDRTAKRSNIGRYRAFPQP